MNYLINSQINLYTEPDHKASFETLFIDSMYFIKYVKELYWYFCVTDDGHKGYVDLIEIKQAFGRNIGKELVVIGNEPRIKRIGPILHISTGDLKSENIIFNNYSYMGYIDFYNVIYTDKDFFVIHREIFEGNAYYIIPFDDLSKYTLLSGYPYRINENLIISCGRSFYPPDLLIFFSVNGTDLEILYSAIVHTENQLNVSDVPALEYRKDKMTITYPMIETIEIMIGKDGLPLDNPKLEYYHID